MKRIYLYIGFILASLSMLSQSLKVDSSYLAGDSIAIELETKTSDSLILLIKHGWGGEMVTYQKEKHVFVIPPLVTRKSGALKLELIKDTEVVWEGHTYIQPRVSESSRIEAYCGPKHLLTDRGDFSMITANVVDIYDNPYESGTVLTFESLIQNRQTAYRNRIKHLIAYQRIYAPDKIGYGALVARHENLGSKEFRLDFYANDPADYQLFFERQHRYGDGNQLIKLYTSVIRDANENLVGNGTLVHFYVHDKYEGNSLATAETIGGVASVELSVPLSSTLWTVSSEIPFYARSNSLEVPFKAAIRDLPIQLIKNGVRGGPVKGFMGQFIKQESKAHLYLIQQNKEVFYFQSPVQKDGMVDFLWLPGSVPAGEYDLKVIVGDFEIKMEKVTIHD